MPFDFRTAMAAIFLISMASLLVYLLSITTEIGPKPCKTWGSVENHFGACTKQSNYADSVDQ